MNKLKFTLTSLIFFCILVSMSYAITIESRSAVYLGETFEIKISLPPEEVSVLYLALPQHSELVQWILHYESVVYDYEVVGVTTVHKWTFLEKSQNELTLNARVNFVRRGQHKYIVYSENGEEFMTEREIVVLDRVLDADTTEPFEISDIPIWLVVLLIVILIVVLVVSFIKIRQWY